MKSFQKKCKEKKKNCAQKNVYICIWKEKKMDVVLIFYFVYENDIYNIYY